MRTFKHQDQIQESFKPVEHHRVNYEPLTLTRLENQDKECPITAEELTKDVRRKIYQCITVRLGPKNFVILDSNAAVKLNSNPFTREQFSQLDHWRMDIYKKAYEVSSKHYLVITPPEENVTKLFVEFLKNNGSLPREGEDGIALLRRLVKFDNTDNVFSTNYEDKSLEVVGSWYLTGSETQADDPIRCIFTRTLVRLIIGDDGKPTIKRSNIIFVDGKGYLLTDEIPKNEDYTTWEWEKYGYPTLITLLENVAGLVLSQYLPSTRVQSMSNAKKVDNFSSSIDALKEILPTRNIVHSDYCKNLNSLRKDSNIQIEWQKLSSGRMASQLLPSLEDAESLGFDLQSEFSERNLVLIWYVLPRENSQFYQLVLKEVHHNNN